MSRCCCSTPTRAWSPTWMRISWICSVCWTNKLIGIRLFRPGSTWRFSGTTAGRGSIPWWRFWKVGDSRTLLPVLQDFGSKYPALQYSIFLGDAAFDIYDTYRALLKEFGFTRAAIPMNCRNTTSRHDTLLDEFGIPLTPVVRTPLKSHSVCGGKNRSKRLKFVCPKTSYIITSARGCSLRCNFDNRCVYIYPDADLRLYPDILRSSPAWAELYAKRTAVERSIGSLKFVLGIEQRKTSNPLTTKADLFFASIVQLLFTLF